MNIGDRIKQIRTERNLTQPQLAELIGIEQSYLSKLENDKSVPSADIFTAILKGLQMDAGVFIKGIDEVIVQGPLKQIPEVALYLNAQSAIKIHNARRWLLGSAAACVVGLTLLVAGYKSFLFSALVYEYQSGGVLKDGEPDELYLNVDSYVVRSGCPAYNSVSGDSEACKELRRNIQYRAQLKTLLLPMYQGSIIYEAADGGRRAYIHRGSQFTNPAANRMLMLVGTFLAFSGLFGFIIEFRLRSVRV